MLAALEAVDLVVLFEEDTPIWTDLQDQAHVLVKGGDYTREQVVGHEIVVAYGGEVLLVDILPGHSTTRWSIAPVRTWHERRNGRRVAMNSPATAGMHAPDELSAALLRHPFPRYRSAT